MNAFSHAPIVTVSLPAIVANWRLLKALHKGGQTAAVVKANAYGLGVIPVATALHEAGCGMFFVATLSEAVVLRAALPTSDIYVFEGLLKGTERDYVAYTLRPVLNSSAQLVAWKTCASIHPTALPAAIHIDTAMHRLGLTLSELQRPDTLHAARTTHADMLMTHYACASDAPHPANARQLEKITAAHALLPHLRTCYANSSGHFLDAQYHGEITRPGCALYGITPHDDAPNPMQPVATLRAPILQVREIDEMGTLGYAATAHVSQGMRTVTVGIGYADGILRTGSNKLYGFIGEHRLPLLGRVTMDMLCFDASAVPDAVLGTETMLTLMDHRQTVDDMARLYRTIGYEVLTSVGARVGREYTITHEDA
jgi:alanine racemase